MSGSTVLHILFILLIISLHYLLCNGAPLSPDSDSPTNSDPPFRAEHRSTVRIVWTCAAITLSSSWACIHPHIGGYRSTSLQRSINKLRIFINAMLLPDQFVARAYFEWAGSRALHAEMERRLGEIGRRANLPGSTVGQMETAKDGIERLGKEGRVFVDEVEQARKGIESGSEGREPKEIPGLCDVGNEKPNAGQNPTLQMERLRGRRRSLAVEWTRFQSLMAQQLEEVEVKNDSAFPEIKTGDWTMTHAHFIHMGGVVFRGLDNKVQYKDFSDWTDHDIEAFFELKLSANDLQDLSKADGFAKAFVIVQCLSFVVQCACRRAYGLPLIQLEVACLVFIASKIGVYAFWWHKPLNIVHPKVIQSVEGRQQSAPKVVVFRWYQAIFWTLATGDVGLLIFPTRGWDNDIVPSLEGRFPVNYCYRHESWSTYVEPLGQTIPTAIGGALCTIAWHSAFPTPAEQFIWRLASVTPPTLSLILLAGFAVIAALQVETSTWVKKLRRCAVCLIILINFGARVVFLVLPLIQLRKLPPLAHFTVPWADYLPHV